ncbi:MAG: guanylate kinase [Mariprofundaceae bacterium]
MPGRLFVISGPSGSGKTSLCAAWLAREPRLKLSISCTTRLPRPGEVDGREYHFLGISEFERLNNEGAFLESAKVHGNYYGTRASDVKAMLAQDFDTLLEIDWQGAAQVATQCPGCRRIFILPPSLAVLRQRLESRGQDDARIIDARVTAAEEEIAHADEAHFQLINDDFVRALNDLLAIYQLD